MIYTADITTVANTAADSKKPTPLHVTKGLVYKIEIDFPHGSAGLLHCQILDQGFQLWPSSTGTSFHSPGYVISFEDTYLKETAPYQFDIRTWNLDETHDHFLQVRVGLVSKEAFIARFMPGAIYEDMLKVLEKVEQRQEKDRLAILADPWSTITETEL